MPKARVLLCFLAAIMLTVSAPRFANGADACTNCESRYVLVCGDVCGPEDPNVKITWKYRYVGGPDCPEERERFFPVEYLYCQVCLA